MRPEKRAVRLFGALPVRAVRGAGCGPPDPRQGLRHDAPRKKPVQAPAAGPQRRAGAGPGRRSWCCSTAITIVRIGGRNGQSRARSGRTATVGLIALGSRAGDARARLCLGAALPAVLPGDRLQRHDPARHRGEARRPRSWPERGRARRSRSASTPTPTATCRGPSSPVQVTDTVADRPARHGDLRARSNNSDLPITGTASFNVEPEQAGAISTRSSASASPSRRCSRARKCACR